MSSLWSWQWQPFAHQYGILPMVVNSLMLGLVTSSVAVLWVLALCSYLFAHERTGHKGARAFLVRATFAAMTVLSGIPPIVLGIFGLFFVLPFWQAFFETNGFGFGTTLFLLTLLILPTVFSFLAPALQEHLRLMGPRCQALGLTPMQTLLRVCFPLSKKTFLLAFSLGFSRAVSDTMIVLLVSGNSPQVIRGLFAPFRSLSAHMGLVVASDPFSPLFYSFYVAGFILVILSLLPQWFIWRWQRKGSLS